MLDADTGMITGRPPLTYSSDCFWFEDPRLRRLARKDKEENVRFDKESSLASSMTS